MKKRPINPKLQLVSTIIIVGAVVFMFRGMLFDTPTNTGENATEETSPFEYQRELGLGTEYLVITQKAIAGDGTNETLEMGTIVNLWNSIDERTADNLNGKVEEGDKVILIDYFEGKDYCKVKANTTEGWTACPNILRLPYKMVDYWYNEAQYEVYKSI